MIAYFVPISCAEIFCAIVRAVCKLVLGLFKMIGGARFGSTFLWRKKKTTKKDFEIITSSLQDTNTTSSLC